MRRVETFLGGHPERKMQLAVERLRRGDTGTDVLEMLRTKYKTTASLSSCISRVRKTLMQELEPDCSALQPYAEAGVALFLASSLEDKVRIQREHRSERSWSPEAESVLATLQLLPPNVAALRLSQQELVDLERTRQATLLRKQETILHVYNAQQWLLYAIRLARESRPDMPIERLASPLLLLCGRRTTELLNGRSTFLPVGATTALFTGQIKKRGKSAPYVIPLLCDNATLAHALAALRARQNHEQLDAAACHARYSKTLARSLFPFVAHAHQLRSVYAAMVYRLYTSDITFNLAAMRFLGHDDVTTSISYNSVRLHDLGEGSYGPLP